VFRLLEPLWIEAKTDELIKDIALEHDMLPIDVVAIIKGESLEH